MTTASDVSALVAELRRSPLSTAAPLMRTLGVGSQASFSRLVARAGDSIVRIGATRARRYAATRPIRDLGSGFPFFRVAPDGSMVRLGRATALAPAGCCVHDAAPLPRWMRGGRGDGVFAGLPLPCFDARPKGFLGQSFARRHAELRLPDRPDDWSDDDTLVALRHAGEDLPGDLVLGEASARRYYESLSRDREPVPRDDRARVYPMLANDAIAGVTPGALVGGAEPKFGALVGTSDAARHALVKFSPSEFSPSARRWCDLLACEHLALETLRARGIDAAASEIVEGGSRVFLEVVRFDRIGARGRRAVVSLAALNAEYLSLPAGAGRWVEAAQRLAALRWISPDIVERVRWLDAFGRFIANADMHLGNLSFLPRDDDTLDLAPVYGMLPMGYAPVAGDVPARSFNAPLPQPGHEAVWSSAGAAAADFWRAAANDDRVSDPFRAIAAQNAAIVERTLDRFDRRSS